MVDKFIRISSMIWFFCSLHCDASEQASHGIEKISCDYEYAHSAVSAGKLYYFDSENDRQELAKLTYIIYNDANKMAETPTIGLKIQEGWLVGSSYLDSYDNQLGVLTYSNTKNEFTILLSEPVEDIYVMPFGYVVVTGGVRILSPQLRELDVSYGSLYVVRVKNEVAMIEKLFELNEEPKASWKTKDEGIIINFQDSSVLLDKNAYLKNVICSDYKYQESN